MTGAVYKPTFWWYNFVMKHVPGQEYDLCITLRGDVVDCIRQVRELLTTDPATPYSFMEAKVIVDGAIIGNEHAGDDTWVTSRKICLLRFASPDDLRKLFKRCKINDFEVKVSKPSQGLNTDVTTALRMMDEALKD